MNRLLVICGPTATGKTACGIYLAKKFGGEIVSADSRQVYKGMDIGTGKDLDKFSIFNFQFSIERKKIGYYKVKNTKIWLYDVVEPDYRFNVADYVRCANLVIKDIWRRGKLPILVGGTGFYIKGIISGIETLGIPPDWKLRKKLEKWEIKKLQEELKKLAPDRWRKMNESDRQNPRRLVRAIEIIKNLKFRNSLQIENSLTGKNKLGIRDFLIIGLRASYKFLYEQIGRRVEERVRQGIEREIEKLIKSGYNWENSALGTTVGYKEWQDFFKRKISQEEAIKHWRFAEHTYARRQMIWFKRDKKINWFDISQKNWQNKMRYLVEKWYYEGANSSQN